MKRFVFGWLAAAALATGCSLEAPTGPKELSVRYQGEKFVVIQPESNFDATDTRKFIQTQDAEHIEQLLLTAPVGKRYGSLPEILTAMETIQFPDYGRSVLEQPTGQKDKRLFFVTIEVPLRHKDRCFTFYGSDADGEAGGYDLVDDFVLEAKPLPKPKDAPPETETQYEQKVITSVKTDGKKFAYFDPLGSKVRDK
ncbi:MAG: hypothetical protein QM775_03390 [Pirellulales bacterium]